MARKAAATPAPSPAAAEDRAERELNADVNEAIARTDSEVFTDAMGDEPLGDDTDVSLEEMGEGLEGDDLEEDEPEGDGAETDEPQAKGAKAEGDEAPEGDEAEVEGEEQPEGDGQRRDERGRFDRQEGYIPPRVLREAKERARDTETELEATRAQLRDMQARMDNFVLQSRQQPAPVAQTAKTAPDMFADPDGYRSWVKEEAKQEAISAAKAQFGEFQALQRQETEARLNTNLSAAASGPRGYEFNVAFRDLTQLDNRNPANRALVQRIVNSPDQAKAVLDWWETDSNPEYVEHIRDQIRKEYIPQRGNPRRDGNGRQFNGRDQQQAPRHEVRLPRSLNSAVGGGSQRISDPEMSDNSEASVFSYGSRR